MLIKLTALIPDLIVELPYATKDNFTGAAVYPANAVAYLVQKPALRLKRVQESLKKRGLGLKVWDAYRPLSVQKIFWQRVPDPRYVADPILGSKHNRGAAVDVTLVSLPMPTDFDDFSERAHRGSCKGHKNLAILTQAMEEQGFLSCESEWWHFEDPEWAEYPLLDMPL